MPRTKTKPGESFTKVKVYFGEDSILKVVPDVNKSGKFDAYVEFALQILAHAKDFEQGVTIVKFRCKNNKARACALGVYAVNDGSADETAMRYYALMAKEYARKHGLKFRGIKLVPLEKIVNILKKRNALVALICARRYGKNSEEFKRIQEAIQVLNKWMDFALKTGIRAVRWTLLKNILGLRVRKQELTQALKGQRKKISVEIMIKRNGRRTQYVYVTKRVRVKKKKPKKKKGKR